MKSPNIRRASLRQLRKLNEEGKLFRDHQEGGGEDLGVDFWENARIVEPREPRSVHLKLDQDVFDYFKSQGKGHLTKMQDVLKSYVRAHTRQR